MRVCSTVNLVAGLALFIAFAFAGCSGQKPEAKNPSDTNGTSGETPSPSPEPEKSGDTAAGGEKSGATASAEKSGEKSGEKSAGSEKGGGDSGEPDKRTTEVVQKVIQDNRKSIRECYDKARKQLPELRGTMTIHFVLDPEGKVKTAELNIERSDLKSPDVSNCAIAILKKLKFPPSSKGMESTINYPFDFKP